MDQAGTGSSCDGSGWEGGWEGGRALTSTDGALCLAGVLVDDVRGDGVLLLLLPHEQDALMDEDVLLLNTTQRQ